MKENGKVEFDDVFHKDIYERLVHEKGEGHLSQLRGGQASPSQTLGYRV